MMNRILRKDPIVEVRCEFRFDSPDWDWTVPGLLWGQIREEFPLKQQFDTVPADAPDDTKESLGVTQLNFWRQDKTALVRTEPNELGIIQRAPYQGWPKLKTMIENVLQKYREIAPSSSLQGLSLRYMNSLPLPSTSFEIEDYLNVYPTVPEVGVSSVASWMQQAHLIKPDDQLLLLFRAGIIPVTEQTDELKPMMVIDVTARELDEKVRDGEEMNWLETAHQQIEDLFFACLKPSYLEMLELEESDHES